MNISTGGPHILLFERDQQLAGLLVSEFQLTGYECHAARTAVEVFDAIARQPIRLVLVNLAQAAAARREFWVALETQRRGRGVQVLTFRCNNIAGYSSQDFEDRAHMTTADVEVDGMMGVMNLVDAVRARVPHISSNTSTTPRIPRASTPLPSMAGQHRYVQTPPPSTSGILSASGTASRSTSAMPDENMQSSPRGPSVLSQAGINTSTSQQSPAYRSSQTYQAAPAPVAPTYQTPQAQNAPSYQPVPPAPTQTYQTQPAAMPPAYQPTQTADAAGISANQSSYTDKIRAVLYPNQRSWTAQGSNGNTASISPEIRALYDPQNVVAPPPTQTGSTEISMLQSLANGQLAPEAPGESGLAQLSRMIQGRQVGSSVPEHEQFNTENGLSRPARPLHTEAPMQPVQDMATTIFHPDTSNDAYKAANTESSTLAPPSPLPPAQEVINKQPMRAAPIEDMPIERAAGGQAGAEGSRRPDVLSRANYGQQPPAALPPLASISSQSPAVTPSTQPAMTRGASTVQRPEQEETVFEQASPATIAPTPHTIEEQSTEGEKEITIPMITELQRDAMLKGAETLATDELSTSPDNAVILDIVQSLPPMPPVTPQAAQSAQQVLSGRATRTLGSVLLEGHLVPQNRLEVAQHVQRMLRGVDLNYQLGEILLMFKLLTPDQLLAASLVSYGLITTTQISALGRIRQELHAIGLEYDLENLLVLFRILTSEQLREVRASWQS